jgi:hypothetical protein
MTLTHGQQRLIENVFPEFCLQSSTIKIYSCFSKDAVLIKNCLQKPLTSA